MNSKVSKFLYQMILATIVTVVVVAIIKNM